MGNEFSVSIEIEGTVNRNKCFHTTLIHYTQKSVICAVIICLNNAPPHIFSSWLLLVHKHGYNSCCTYKRHQQQKQI